MAGQFDDLEALTGGLQAIVLPQDVEQGDIVPAGLAATLKSELTRAVLAGGPWQDDLIDRLTGSEGVRRAGKDLDNFDASRRDATKILERAIAELRGQREDAEKQIRSAERDAPKMPMMRPGNDPATVEANDRRLAEHNDALNAYQALRDKLPSLRVHVTELDTKIDAKRAEIKVGESNAIAERASLARTVVTARAEDIARQVVRQDSVARVLLAGDDALAGFVSTVVNALFYESLRERLVTAGLDGSARDTVAEASAHLDDVTRQRFTAMASVLLTTTLRAHSILAAAKSDLAALDGKLAELPLAELAAGRTRWEALVAWKSPTLPNYRADTSPQHVQPLHEELLRLLATVVTHTEEVRQAIAGEPPVLRDQIAKVRTEGEAIAARIQTGTASNASSATLLDRLWRVLRSAKGTDRIGPVAKQFSQASEDEVERRAGTNVDLVLGSIAAAKDISDQAQSLLGAHESAQYLAARRKLDTALADSGKVEAEIKAADAHVLAAPERVNRTLTSRVQLATVISFVPLVSVLAATYLNYLLSYYQHWLTPQDERFAQFKHSARTWMAVGGGGCLLGVLLSSAVFEGSDMTPLAMLSYLGGAVLHGVGFFRINSQLTAAQSST